MRAAGRAAVVAALLAGLVVLGLLAATLVAVARTPLPASLAASDKVPSVRVLDREGLLLLEVTSQGERVAAVRLATLPAHVRWAVLAAEDQRFYSHPGVDPLAMTRAAAQALWFRRLVSGASTITQQLARAQFERPRTLAGKWREMVVALRIERELDKDSILEAYLNRVDFAPRIQGLEAASRALFDKPAADLDLAEAALLVGLPRGPSLYDPSRGTERAKRRRDRILERLRELDVVPHEAIERALAEPVRLQRSYRGQGAQHLARALARGELVAGTSQTPFSEVRTTLDAALQREVESLARATIDRLVQQDASAASVLVIDNRSAEVLAYVGSQDFWAAESLGQNDGLRALRQPGSTLKPFVYAEALELRQFTLASPLPDVELHLPTSLGDYSPRNYDGAFHGPVRLHTALASSLNVPAVYTAQRLGPALVLERLRDFGFASLTGTPSEYGVAIALGDGEITALELARAYLSLANGGKQRDLRFVAAARDTRGNAVVLPPNAERRVVGSETAHLLSHALSDASERQSGFGRDSVLELPFPVAVKTGTSKGYRDNWTVGYSSEVTVLVWVGNFDGHPMQHSSGVTGAGPLFHDVMLAAMRRREALPVSDHHGLHEREVCALSGAAPGPACGARTRELFLPGTEPAGTCEFHERVSVLPDSNLRAGPSCRGAVERTFERYPDPYRAWALAAGRPLAPERFDPRCPGTLDTESSNRRAPRVVYPFDGARFSRDANLSLTQQRLVFRANVREPELVFWVDDQRWTAERAAAGWELTPGEHTLAAESTAGRGPTIRFRVD